MNFNQISKNPKSNKMLNEILSDNLNCNSAFVNKSNNPSDLNLKKNHSSFTTSDKISNPKLANRILIREHTNTSLHERLKYLVLSERKLLTTIIDYLAEVKRRRLYAELGYSSLFNYCVKELGYSESATLRRLNAIKLVSECPEIKEKLKSGVLNLTTVSMAQTFFQKEKNLFQKNNLYLNPDSRLQTQVNLNFGINDNNSIDRSSVNANSNSFLTKNNTNSSITNLAQRTSIFNSPAAKINFLETLENKTIQQVQNEFVKISPYVAKFNEQQKPLTENLTELKITLNKTQLQKLKRLKELRPDFKSTAELLEWSLDQSLKKLDPLINAQVHTTVTEVITTTSNPVNPNSKSKPSLLNKKISLKSHVHLKSNSQCSFVSESGQKCLETYGLEVDHIHPKAKGGSNSPNNLRLLCKAHNQFEAVKHFGAKQMGFYLK